MAAIDIAELATAQARLAQLTGELTPEDFASVTRNEATPRALQYWLALAELRALFLPAPLPKRPLH